MNLDSITIVLVGTTHSGNIGATARAMANMGLADLRLVAPRATINEAARARACGAEHILDAARTFASLPEAVFDSVLVMGTSARRRESRWRCMDPREAAGSLAATAAGGHRVAVVFGRESSGLSNAELDCCDALVSIPVNPDYPSVNLAAAVTVIGYELRMRHLAARPDSERAAAKEDDTPATAGEREHFFEHLSRVLDEIEFIKSHGREKLMRKIRHLYMKAHPNSQEVAILRGILSALEQKLRK